MSTQSFTKQIKLPKYSITSNLFENEIIKIKKTNDITSIFLKLNLQTQKPIQWFMKRFLDFSLTITGLIIISPFLLLIALMIKLDSKGPVLFKQKRIGLNGKEFYMYKFRSMVVDAEEKLEELKDNNQTNDVMFKMFDDPRITKAGKFLRKYSLDELPQLFNVLKGEMSLVGPRPPLPREIKKYEKWHHIKFTTIPGLTGMWQVSGRAAIQEFDSVIELDYKYIKNWNLLLDLKLLLKTIPVVLSGKGAA